MKLNKIKVELYPHQTECVLRSCSARSLLIADDMGLGKTLEALTISAVDFEAGRARRVLVVTPATLKWNWFDEIEQLSTFNAVVLDGSPASRRALLADFNSEILIVNYEQVGPHLDELNSLEFDIVIFDEAHYIKNPRSKRTKACHKLRGRRFFPMTGTPLLNRVDELWSLLHVTEPRQFPSYWKFKNRYCVMGGYQGKQVVGTQNQDELTEKLSKVMIRRTKDEVLDLPDKIRTPIHVVLTPEQQALYNQVLKEWRLSLPNRPTAMEIENAMVQLLRLKQICSTPANLFPDRVQRSLNDNSYKLDVAVERTKELWEAGESSVIFTQFRGTHQMLGARLRKTDVPVFGIHGGMSTTERRDQIQKWEQSGGAFVAMIQVGSTGLTLTRARTVIFVDKLWTPGLNTQAEDRLHRIGQTKNVNIIDIQARNTIETRIEEILRGKSKLADMIVGGAAGWKSELIEELRSTAL